MKFFNPEVLVHCSGTPKSNTKLFSCIVAFELPKSVTYLSAFQSLFLCYVVLFYFFISLAGIKKSVEIDRWRWCAHRVRTQQSVNIVLFLTLKMSMKFTYRLLTSAVNLLPMIQVRNNRVSTLSSPDRSSIYMSAQSATRITDREISPATNSIRYRFFTRHAQSID